MIALKVETKELMTKLLTTETFDNFLIVEGTITTASSFSIDGKINREFMNDLNCGDAEIIDDYRKWGELRKLSFELVKGKVLPVFFKVVLQLSEKNKESFLQSIGSPMKLEDVASLCMNISFDRKECKIVTGTSIKVFSLDKTLDREWDEMVKKFLTKNDIAFEEI